MAANGTGGKRIPTAKPGGGAAGSGASRAPWAGPAMGAVLTGRRGGYTVLRPASGTPGAVICSGPSGEVLIRVYARGNMRNPAARAAWLALPSHPNILAPSDWGELGESPFDVFPLFKNGDLAGRRVGPRMIAGAMVPQLNDALHFLHTHDLIHRDVKPENILISDDGRRLLLCDFESFAPLGGQDYVAAGGEGLTPGYAAPEAAQFASPRSDYYALGVTILGVLAGRYIYEGMAEQEIVLRGINGMIPTLDHEKFARGRANPADEADRVAGLALGLVQHDPALRWGYEQVTRWQAGKLHFFSPGTGGGRRFSTPYPVRGQAYWSPEELAPALGADWHNTALAVDRGVLSGFFSRENPQIATELCKAASVSGCSGADRADAQAFLALYAVYPSLPGLWWRGVCYRSAATLASHLSAAPAEELCSFGALLRNRGLSRFAQGQRTGGHMTAAQADLLASFETAESAAAMDGVYRFIYQMLPGDVPRTYRYAGTLFSTADELAAFAESHDRQFHDDCAAILADGMFAAWLWAQGGEGYLTATRRSVAGRDKDTVFRGLLRLLERMASDPRPLRRLALKWGGSAHIAWLRAHLGLYTFQNEQLRLDFERVMLGDQLPISELYSRLGSLQAPYNAFVRGTETNPFVVRDGRDTEKDICPRSLNGFFIGMPDGRELPLGFLRDSGTGDLAFVRDWLEQCRGEELIRLKAIGESDVSADAALLPDTKEEYLAAGRRGIIACGCMLAVILLCAVICALTGRLYLCLAGVLGTGFPILVMQNYYRKMALAKLDFDRQKAQAAAGERSRRAAGSLALLEREMLEAWTQGKDLAITPGGRIRPEAKEPPLQPMGRLADQPATALFYLSMFGAVSAVSGAAPGFYLLPLALGAVLTGVTAWVRQSNAFSPSLRWWGVCTGVAAAVAAVLCAIL